MEEHLKSYNTDELKELCEMLAESNPVWNDVLKGTRIGMIFDAETGDTVSFNRESV